MGQSALCLPSKTLDPSRLKTILVEAVTKAISVTAGASVSVTMAAVRTMMVLTAKGSSGSGDDDGDSTIEN